MADRNDDLRTSYDARNTGEFSSLPSSDDPAAIRAEIDETRSRMSETLDEIGERLNPNVVKERVKDSIREATIGRVEHMARKTANRMNDTRLTMMETVRQNPIPAALVGVGLAWLIVNGGRARSRRAGGDVSYRSGAEDWYRGGTAGFDYDEYGNQYASDVSGELAGEYVNDYEGAEGGTGRIDRIRGRAADVADTVKGRASDIAHRAQETASRTRQRARETAERVGTRARETAGRVRERASETAAQARERARTMSHNVAETSRRQAQRVEDAYFENPLALGAITLAAGFAVGLGVPRTEAETNLFGERRDQLMDQARDAAMETREKVQHVAERVVEEGKRTVKDAARDEGLVPQQHTSM